MPVRVKGEDAEGKAELRAVFLGRSVKSRLIVTKCIALWSAILFQSFFVAVALAAVIFLRRRGRAAPSAYRRNIG